MGIAYFDANGHYTTREKSVRSVSYPDKPRAGKSQPAAFVDPGKAGEAAGAAAREPDARPDSGRPKSPGSSAAAGTGTAGSKESASLDLSSCIGILQGAHAFLAMTRQQPHWLLNDADAKVYGEALRKALRHFPTGVSQKAIDFGMLTFIALQMESPRVMLSMQMKGSRARGPAQVFPFPSGPLPAGPAAQPVRPTGRANQTVRVQQQEPVEGFVPDGIDSPLGGL